MMLGFMFGYGLDLIINNFPNLKSRTFLEKQCQRARMVNGPVSKTGVARHLGSNPSAGVATKKLIILRHFKSKWH